MAGSAGDKEATAATAATAVFRAARDQLWALRGQHARALAELTYPDVGPTFCWAVDWFDAIARGNSRPALVIVEEDGASTSLSFDALAARSDRVAAWLAGHGVGRGDAVILMLGNQVELWDCMLAVMKLGAVIVPTTTAVGTSDLIDRIERAGATTIVTNPDQTHKLDGVAAGVLRVSIGEVPGWQDLHRAYAVDVPATPHPGTGPDDPLLLYFTSGTTSRPKLVEHTQISYPVGHLSTMYWLGLQPGDVHLNISSPGWAKHAWACFFAPWIGDATSFVNN